MLEQLGYEVQAVCDATDALAAVEKGSFDVVVTDIVMPGSMDGTALANAIRALKPDLPVLLMTGYKPANAGSEFAILRKPFQLSDLGRAITRLSPKQDSRRRLTSFLCAAFVRTRLPKRTTGKSGRMDRARGAAGAFVRERGSRSNAIPAR